MGASQSYCLAALQNPCNGNRSNYLDPRQTLPAISLCVSLVDLCTWQGEGIRGARPRDALITTQVGAISPEVVPWTLPAFSRGQPRNPYEKRPACYQCPPPPVPLARACPSRGPAPPGWLPAAPARRTPARLRASGRSLAPRPQPRSSAPAARSRG